MDSPRLRAHYNEAVVKCPLDDIVTFDSTEMPGWAAGNMRLRRMSLQSNRFREAPVFLTVGHKTVVIVGYIPEIAVLWKLAYLRSPSGGTTNVTSSIRLPP